MSTPRIGTRHTVKVSASRALEIQANTAGNIVLSVVDRTGAAASVEVMELDPATCGALAFAFEQSCEAIEAQRARGIRLAHELQRAAA